MLIANALGLRDQLPKTLPESEEGYSNPVGHCEMKQQIENLLFFPALAPPKITS